MKVCSWAGVANRMANPPSVIAGSQSGTPPAPLPPTHPGIRPSGSVRGGQRHNPGGLPPGSLNARTCSAVPFSLSPHPGKGGGWCRRWGSRTHTPFRIRDFESRASAIPPLRQWRALSTDSPRSVKPLSGGHLGPAPRSAPLASPARTTRRAPREAGRGTACETAEATRGPGPRRPAARGPAPGPGRPSAPLATLRSQSGVAAGNRMPVTGRPAARLTRGRTVELDHHEPPCRKGWSPAPGST